MLDNRAGIQHAIIHNPRIDNNGNFSGIIVDYYDLYIYCTKKYKLWKYF